MKRETLKTIETVRPGENQKFRRIEIWTDGKASEQVKDELNRRAIAYRHISLISDD
jgi:hypothetical protein